MHLRTKANDDRAEAAGDRRVREAFDCAPLAMAIVVLDAKGSEPRVHRSNEAFARLAQSMGAEADGRLIPLALVTATLQDGTERRSALSLTSTPAAATGADGSVPRVFAIAILPMFEGGPAPSSALVTLTPTTAVLARAARIHERLRGMVGHDLRNPLSAVITAASLLLRRGGLPAPHESAARRIDSASQRMARMISHILELSRAALDEPTTAMREASDLAAIVRSAATEHAASIEVTIEAEHPGEWDGDLLRDAIASILRNAVEHARPETRPRLVVRALGGDTIEILVDNDGTPIAPELASRVVDVDALGDHGKRPGHLGLGLFVAARAVAAHGGSVTLVSHGDGTRVRVLLPVRATSAASDTPE